MRASLWRAIGTTVAEPEKEKAALVKSKTDMLFTKCFHNAARLSCFFANAFATTLRECCDGRSKDVVLSSRLEQPMMKDVIGPR